MCINFCFKGIQVHKVMVMAMKDHIWKATTVKERYILATVSGLCHKKSMISNLVHNMRTNTGSINVNKHKKQVTSETRHFILINMV